MGWKKYTPEMWQNVMFNLLGIPKTHITFDAFDNDEDNVRRELKLGKSMGDPHQQFVVDQFNTSALILPNEEEYNYDLRRFIKIFEKHYKSVDPQIMTYAIMGTMTILVILHMDNLLKHDPRVKLPKILRKSQNQKLVNIVTTHLPGIWNELVAGVERIEDIEHTLYPKRKVNYQVSDAQPTTAPV